MYDLGGLLDCHWLWHGHCRLDQHRRDTDSVPLWKSTWMETEETI